MNLWVNLLEHAINIAGLAGFYLWGYRRGEAIGYARGVRIVNNMIYGTSYVSKYPPKGYGRHAQRKAGTQEEPSQASAQRESEGQT